MSQRRILPTFGELAERMLSPINDRELGGPAVVTFSAEMKPSDNRHRNVGLLASLISSMLLALIVGIVLGAGSIVFAMDNSALVEMGVILSDRIA